MAKILRNPITVDVFRRCGGVSKIADALAVSQSAVSQWSRVPERHVQALSDKSGIAPEVIRPDLVFPKPKG